MKSRLLCVVAVSITTTCYAQTNESEHNLSVNYENHSELHVEPMKKKNFMGIGIGETIFSRDDNKNDIESMQDIKDQRKKFWNIYTGHYISDNYSVKAEYLKLVDFKNNQKYLPDFKIRALSFSGLGFYPINMRASVFGEAGIYAYRAKESSDSNLKTNQQSSGTKPFVGLGLKYDLGKTDLILKYNNYGKISNSFYQGNFAQIQFNVEYKF